MARINLTDSKLCTLGGKQSPGNKRDFINMLLITPNYISYLIPYKKKWVCHVNQALLYEQSISSYNIIIILIMAIIIYN